MPTISTCQVSPERLSERSARNPGESPTHRDLGGRARHRHLACSMTKFWRMIGRGTRMCRDLFPAPARTTRNFYVFDYCGNLKHFGKPLPESPGSLQKSLNQKLFETRLGLITAADPAEGQATETDRGLSVDVCNSPGRDQVRRRPDPVHQSDRHRTHGQRSCRTEPAVRVAVYRPCTDRPRRCFVDADVDNIVQILNTVKGNAIPADGVA